MGYPVAKIDGKAGMNTRSLIGAYQKANNIKVDCWPTEALLAHVRSKAPTKGTGLKGASAAPDSSAGTGATRGARSPR
jgi:hypothetical protein